MAAKDIIQNMISQLGQSQDDRMPAALDPHFAEVEERTTDDLLRFTKKFASLVAFYPSVRGEPPTDWSKFFSYHDDPEALQALRERSDGQTPPHLALFLSFLELCRQPQSLINRFTGRHLDFYYHDVLRLEKKPAVADKAHVLMELKKQAPPFELLPSDLFSAGKDGKGAEVIYAPVRKAILNLARVESLRSIFVDPSDHGAVHYAPMANSSDGVGGPLPEDDPKWRGFGHAELPSAEVGFALAAPVLRMKEGSRKITVSLALKNLAGGKRSATDPPPLTSASLKNAFNVFITAEKNWASLDVVSVRLGQDGILKFELAVAEGERAIVDYAPAIHGYHYTAEGPILQFLLNADQSAIGYNDFKNVTVEKIQVAVTVNAMSSLNLEGDSGSLDASKVFLPFGAQPVVGSTFSIGCDEALSKKLSKVDIALRWKGAPSNFNSHYTNYGIGVVANNYFTAGISFVDASGATFGRSAATLFETSNATSPHTIELVPGVASDPPSPAPAKHIRALSKAGGKFARHAEALAWIQPVFGSYLNAAPEARPGFIQIELQRDFFHTTYRTKYVQNVMAYSKSGSGNPVIPNDPYTPTIQSISLSYQAHSDEVDIASTDLTQFANLDVQFFHVAYFGQMREHGYQRSQFNFLPSNNVSLLPVYEHEGELLIGFSSLNPRDSVSVLFEVAEGSADPELAQEPIAWSVLCENYWKSLGSEGVVLDTTNQLLTSGIIEFIIPAEATTQNTILPSDYIWLRAGLTRNVTAVSQLLMVAANAVELEFRDQGNDPERLTSALKAGTITKLKSGMAAVKTVKQPYASFGGGALETDKDFYRRVSERLRHKGRCITAWDYERIILEAFPRVHKVKCIPHARAGGWLAPGHVLIIVVPDLRNKNALNALQPKVDADTLSRIGDFVRERTGMQVEATVKNPSYQEIQLDFKVKFRTGYEFTFYRKDLEQRLFAFLSPWAFAAERDISFGGKIYKSVLLDFVEDLDPVDYVTDFKMFSYITTPNKVDVSEARPETPATILVSARTHVIKEAE